MDKRRMYQWLLLAIICLSFSMGESYAQKKDFANLARYSKQNAALPQATKKINGLFLWEIPSLKVG